MAGHYERIEAHDDDDDFESPQGPAPSHAIPSSPPPSFHSRASSIRSSRDRGGHRDVDPDLADAFDTADELSDDEADDRQRLVRRPSHPSPAEAGAAALANSSGSLARSRPAGSATHQAGTNSTGQPQQQQSDQSAARAGAPPARTVPGRVYGSGIQSDGVFSNLSAKPERDNGEKEELPPSYEQAAADAAPPYWETTILAPGFGAPNDVYIDGLPVGSVFSFIWNGMISMSFQLVGFLLTYLLHSTHASKQGSRAGLGITFIQYGFYMKGNSDAHGGMGGAGSGGGGSGGGDGYANPPDPNAHDFNPGSVQGAGGGDGGGAADIASGDWAAFILMTVGWFVLLKSVSDFIKARRHEQLVLQSPDRGLGIPIIATGEGVETVV